MAKTVGILTSGGDCAGLNAVMRAVVHRADRLGWTVIGIENGTAGLLEDPYEVRTLKPEDFDGFIMRRGGTILGTTNSRNPFKYEMDNGEIKDRSDEVIAALKDLGIEALIGIGGDGTLRGAALFHEEHGIPVVGCPGTIDNDLFGFLYV